MFVSWQWISEMVDTAGVDPVALAERFTLAVAEIEGVTRFGDGLSDVRIARVLEVSAHPNADKLRLAHCLVDGEEITVVCGAPDLEKGGLYPFVPPGVTLPSGIEVRHGEVRGVPSPGMLASEKDLGLSDEHGGLLSLDGLGERVDLGFADALGLPDVLWEIDNKSITHRPDLWGIFGIAREVAALLDRPLQPLPTTGLTFTEQPPVQLSVAGTSHCFRYLCAAVEGVVVKPSPVAIRLRLRSLGVRPISNVVDATNLVMLETGNPLHAFDGRDVRGGAIAVRQAEDGEVLRTLDGIDRTLSADDCVIADAEGPVALAGVMGGEDSEIKDDTTKVILEAASFDGAAIRKTATRQGMRTESSARFEKHLDPATAEIAARRFLVTLRQLSPGSQITSALLDAGPFVQSPPAPRYVRTSGGYVRSRLGVTEEEMSDAWIDKTLAALGFETTRDGDEITVKVPSFRAGRDIGIPEDLVEELGRIYGYDHVRSAVPLVPSRQPILPRTKRQEREVRAVCALQRGLNEVLLYSFDDEPLRTRLGLAEADEAGGQKERLALRNFLSSENTHLRRTLVSNLVGCLESNLERGTRSQPSKKGLRVGLFELGRVFLPEREHIDRLGVEDRGVPAVAMTTDPGHDAFVGRMDDALRTGTQTSADFAATHHLPAQPRRVAIAIGERLGGGAMGADDVIVPSAEVSQGLFGEVRGAIEAIAQRLGYGDVELVAGVSESLLGQSWVHPARAAVVRIGDREVGAVAMLHPRVRGRLSVPADVAIGTLDLDALLNVPIPPLRAGAPPRFPATTFDMTLAVTPEDRAGSLAESLLQRGKSAHPEILESVQLIAHYHGQGRRTLTYRVTCRHDERTLADNEIKAVRKTLGAAEG